MQYNNSNDLQCACTDKIKILSNGQVYCGGILDQSVINEAHRRSRQYSRSVVLKLDSRDSLASFRAVFFNLFRIKDPPN